MPTGAAAYIQPSPDLWPPELQCLSRTEAAELAIVDLSVEFTHIRGGKAPMSNLKNTSLTRARWRPRLVEGALTSDATRRAYAWLMDHNATYRAFARQHADIPERR
eukprot:2298866-Lingulodinium_polyedra.AAC.1